VTVNLEGEGRYCESGLTLREHLHAQTLLDGLCEDILCNNVTAPALVGSEKKSYTGFIRFAHT